jgi:hypothetical protein
MLLHFRTKRWAVPSVQAPCLVYTSILPFGPARAFPNDPFPLKVGALPLMVLALAPIVGGCSWMYEGVAADNAGLAADNEGVAAAKEGCAAESGPLPRLVRA